VNRIFRDWFTRPQPQPMVQVLWGVLWVTVALATQAALKPLTGDFAQFLTFFPSVMAAGVLSGGLAGPTSLVLSALAAGSLMLAGSTGALRDVQVTASLTAYLAAGAAMLWITSQLRSAVWQVSAAREQEHLMLGELQHRVKNTLAIVQAITAQTLQSDPAAAELKRRLTERLVALGEAHNLLSETGWREVSLHALVERSVRPFVGSRSPRLWIDGDDNVQLAPEQVVNVAICLHELATNATKYGAWSGPDGQVKASWRVKPSWRKAEPPLVQLEWLEGGGPLVAKPQRVGFGSRMLQQIPTSRSGARAIMEFAPEGLRWRAEFDLPAAK
jgi:two-component sensor histidine kinase